MELLKILMLDQFVLGKRVLLLADIIKNVSNGSWPCSSVIWNAGTDMLLCG